MMSLSGREEKRASIDEIFQAVVKFLDHKRDRVLQ